MATLAGMSKLVGTGIWTRICRGNHYTDGDAVNKTTSSASFVKVQRGTMNVTTSGVAGTHTLNLTLPAGAMLLDIVVHCVALWNAGTSAVLNVGDNTDPNGYFAAVDMKATDLIAGESINFSNSGGLEGDLIVGTVATNSNTHWETRYQAASRTIDAVLTLVGTTATTGETVIDVIYTMPSGADTTVATYAAT